MTPPSPIGLDLSRVEDVNRFVLAVAFTRNPTYLGAAHSLTVVDNLCGLLGKEHVVEIADDRQKLGEAMMAAMVAVDLDFHIAENIITSVLYRISRLANDASNAFEPVGAGEVWGQVAYLVNGDPFATQYLLDEAGLTGRDAIALPTKECARTLVNMGLLHFSEALYSEDYLRVAARNFLLEYSKEIWHSVHFVTEVFCDEMPSCGLCPCSLSPSGDACHAVANAWF